MMLRRICAAVRGAVDVKVEQIAGLPVLEIKVDKAAIARRGLSVSAVQDVIGAAVGGQEAGVIFEGDRSFEIIVRLPESVRADLEALSNLPVALPKATPNAPVQTVALNRVAKFSFAEGPNQISRENGKRRIVVTANVRGRDLGSVVEEAQQRVARNVKLPAGYWITWGGQSENLAAARQRLAIVVPACFVMIFLLLLSAMGSARDALLVFSAVPLALTGGVFALWLRGMPFSISAAVGFIALSGVAVLNGLVMLSYIRQLREQGMPLGSRHREGRTDAVPARHHDGARGLARFPADGVFIGHRRRGAEAVCHSRHRRPDQRHAADACGAARALRTLRPRGRTRAGGAGHGLAGPGGMRCHHVVSSFLFSRIREIEKFTLCRRANQGHHFVHLTR